MASVKNQLTFAPGVEVDLRPLSAITQINKHQVKLVTPVRNKIMLSHSWHSAQSCIKEFPKASVSVFPNKKEFFQKKRHQHSCHDVVCSCYLKPKAPFATRKHALATVFYHFPTNLHLQTQGRTYLTLVSLLPSELWYHSGIF